MLKQSGEENVPQNGILGPETERAIQSYQKKKKQLPDGLISKALIKMLEGKEIK